MSLLIDKYAIHSKDDIVFNKEIYERLLGIFPTPKKVFAEKKYFEDNSHLKFTDCIQQYIVKCKTEKIKRFSMIGNLLIHGFNKSALIKILLQELYGSGALNVKTVPYDIESYNAKEKVVDIQQSPYHIVIEANGTGLDKIIIQEIIKNYATTLFFKTEKTLIPYKIVLINNADRLSTYAQASLRRTMESYYNTCRFILCASEISNIILPLRSRCSNIRLPKPTNNELISYVANVANKENIKISFSHIQLIVSKSNRNIKTCLWWLQHYIYNIYDYTESWKLHLKKIISVLKYIHDEKVVLKIIGIIILRTTINEILLTNVPCKQIMMELVCQLISDNPNFGYSCHKRIIELFYKYELRLATGTRHIIHIEALYIEICKMLYEMPKVIYPNRKINEM